VLAALDDAAACFYVDQSRVTMAGYSSGAEVAYAVGLGNAQRFNGILIEDGACSDNPNETALLANAAWKINIAHITHASDEDYPEKSVEADWAKIKAAGFPLQTNVVAGTHDGTSDDWYSWLEPKITGWTAP
jgi:predicted esterase